MESYDIDEGLATEQVARAEQPPSCLFTTGCAGTGKTYNAVKAVRDDPSSGILSSTTGISAVNLGAITINSLLKYSDVRVMRDHFLTGALSRVLHSLAKQYRNLIVDEISMFGGDALDILYRAVEDANRYVDVPVPMGIHIIGDMCFALGTKVSMYDGTLQSVEHVSVGDLVMGPDSKPRTVIRKFMGAAPLYKIKQTNADTYTVTENHKVVLRRGKDGQRQEWGGSKGVRYPEYGDDHTMSAKDLHVKSNKFGKVFVGYKVGCVEFPAKPVGIDPYFLGLWLGDGDSDQLRITTNDEEVAQYCKYYAEKFGLKLTITGWPHRTEARRIGLANAKGRNGGKGANTLWNRFTAYHLKMNKHIPLDYLANEENIRLQLLAGLIDTDGSWGGNRYTISSTQERLAKGIKQLADQLGFRTAIRFINNGHYKDTNKCWCITVGGDTWRIPCRIARKKSFPRNLGRSRTTSTLKVESIGVGDFAGFELDGDNMFLLADGTVAHNCQLPPVKAPWVFTASCWERFRDNTETLTKVWRQGDTRFLSALNLVRCGEGAAAVEVLTSLGARFETALDTEFDGTTILPRNDQVGRYNALALDRVPGSKFKVTSRRWGAQRSEWGQSVRTKEWGIPPEVELKIGAYVMLLANHPEFEWVNGDCGWIEAFDDSSGPFGDDPGGMLAIRLVRTKQVIHLSRLTRGVEHSERPAGWPATGDRIPPASDDGGWHPRPHYRGRVKRWVTGQISYFPLRLAYATTVHKSQSLTLDRVQCDFRGHFFQQPAMLYVALSRCRTLAGLRLVGMAETFAKHCNFDERIREWL
jgi:hypothetical protein